MTPPNSSETSPFDTFEVSASFVSVSEDRSTFEATSFAEPVESAAQISDDETETPQDAEPIFCLDPKLLKEQTAENPGSLKQESLPEKAQPAGPGFRDLPLREEVLESVLKAGYETPTEIQAQIIPHVLEGRDILAQSQTGTGKTAAFALPILSRIDIAKRHPQVLVLAPTRELAIQVSKSFSTYASCLKGFSVAAIYGGHDYTSQFRQLKSGVQVVVGTPGRVIDHIKRGTLDLSELSCLVLDEADEMLNMGFLEDVEFVLEQTPCDRQVALFSATLPPPIRSIAQRYLNDPAKVTVKKKTVTAESIRQRAIYVSPRDKMDTLKRLLEVEDTDGVLIFTNTKDSTVVVAEQLAAEGHSALALNGDMPQKVRERTIEQLKARRLDIVVATDVAARGLDVSRVSHVINFDAPQDNDSYIHRIGRTGRAGRTGEAFILLAYRQRKRLWYIEQATKQPIEIVEPPTADEINAKRVQNFKQQIAATISEADLSLFQQLVGEFAQESEAPPELIAAALAQISQNGRPFFVEDRPRRKPKESFEKNGDRNSHRESRPKKDGRRRSNELAPPEEGKVRYRLDVGWRNGAKPGNIVGAIANEAGLAGADIGPIRIHDHHSTVDLPEGMPADIFQILKRTRVAGRPLNLVESDGSEPEPSERPSGKRNFHGKKRGKGRGKSFAHGKKDQGRKGRKRKAGSHT